MPTPCRGSTTLKGRTTTTLPLLSLRAQRSNPQPPDCRAFGSQRQEREPPRQWTIDSGLSTIDYRLVSHHASRITNHPDCRAFGSQRQEREPPRQWTIDSGLSTIDYRLSTADYRLVSHHALPITRHASRSGATMSTVVRGFSLVPSEGICRALSPATAMIWRCPGPEERRSDAKG